MQRQLTSILVIAGSDCSGGAGIQADIRAASVRGVFASTTVTAVTTQNSHDLSEIVVLNPQTVAGQIKSVFDDCHPMAVKIGMLGSIENGMAVADFLREHAEGIPIVVDPVMKASAGGNLTRQIDEITEFYVNELCPLATIVTPNLGEAISLGGNGANQLELATSLLDVLKCKAIVLKGGHAKGNLLTDVLAMRTNCGCLEMKSISASKVDCHNLHGTGCTYSSILAAELAKGQSIEEAFQTASWLLKGFISESSGYSLGNSNYGPLNLFNYHCITQNI